MNAIKQGYKQTKVGIIPVNWEVVKLGKLGDLIGGGTPSTKNEIHWIGNIPWISSSDLNENSIYDISISRFINENAIKNSATKLIPKNSILIVSRVGVGKIAINNQPLCTSQDFQSLVLKKDNHIFLAYKIKNEIQKLIACNQGTSIKGFVKEDLSNLQIPLPPLKEQEKIAEILTTWDEAITKQTELLRAKELQKKALMQKLLSGEVRFSRFSDEWEEVRLGEIGQVVTGTTPPTDTKAYYENGQFPWITPTDINDKKDIRKSERYLTSLGLEKGRFIPKGSLLVTCIASIGKNAILTVDGSCNQQINAILPSEKNNINYLYYFIEFKKDYLIKFAGQSATQILNKKSFSSLKIKLPSLPEQQKIAEVLSLADDEINLLKNELEELKQQKKALMQKLLTGEVRVKV